MIGRKLERAEKISIVGDANSPDWRGNGAN